MFARVVAKKLFVQLASHLADNNVFRRLDPLSGLGDLLEELLYFKRSQTKTVEGIDRIQVDRDGNDLPIDTGAHSMLIRAPLGESG